MREMQQGLANLQRQTDSMDLNEPIMLDNEQMFCGRGNDLALFFLNEAREAVKLVGVAENKALTMRVQAALLSLMKHKAKCSDCNEG